MLLLYKILTTILYPFLIIFIFFRKLKKKEHSSRYKEKIFSANFNVNRKENTKLLWFHAASIGELGSIIPIIEDLNSNNKMEFLITTTTLSSSNYAYKEFNRYDNVHHRFLPLDVSFLIKTFLNRWMPTVVFLVDSEIWPNLILEIKKNKLPLALINARITNKSFKRWKFFLTTSRKIFSLINLSITSNEETKKYLQELNVKNIYHYGNIKLANKVEESKIKNLNEKILKENKFWFAASTHYGEETLCLKVHLNLKKRFKKMITIIAPRHVARSNEIMKLCNEFKLPSQILGKDDVIQDGKEIIIINSFGVLNNFFKYTKSTFIGKSTIKSLKNDAGQNPIDAAKLACKIYHGPYVYNFQEIYQILKNNNISKTINDEIELSNNLIQDFESIDSKNFENVFFLNELGNNTFNKTMKKINSFIFDESK